MRNIIVEKPYRFHAPVESRFWPAVLGTYLPVYLRRSHGLVSVAVQGEERLQASVAAGHGIMLAPNHCRPCDPMVLAQVAVRLKLRLFIMASRHLFEESAVQRYLLRRAGAFSLYREGMDRESLKCAVTLLAEARRPLVVFPEGVISRTNDRLNPLMEGVSFMARSAAKQRAALPPGGRVVIHPVAIRYRFDGDLDAALDPVLTDIERRLSWRPMDEGLSARIARIGKALLALKEIQYLGEVRTGPVTERLAGLIDRLLGPLEAEWIKGRREPDVVGRVKALRTAILADMVTGELAEPERARRWRQLEDCYLAQQLHFYPPDYFAPDASREKMLETVERFEEDLTDAVTVHAPVRALVEVGEAIEVGVTRERGTDGDPVMGRVRDQLLAMLGRAT